jgi:hypothetical protein
MLFSGTGMVLRIAKWHSIYRTSLDATSVAIDGLAVRGRPQALRLRRPASRLWGLTSTTHHQRGTDAAVGKSGSLFQGSWPRVARPLRGRQIKCVPRGTVAWRLGSPFWNAESLDNDGPAFSDTDWLTFCVSQFIGLAGAQHLADPIDVLGVSNLGAGAASHSYPPPRSAREVG